MVISVNRTDESNDRIEKEVKELEDINNKQEERIHKLETKALQLTNLYFVFQGVILSTVATKSLHCRRSWIPFVLSLLAAVLNTAALSHTILAFVKCSEELDQNLEDLKVIKSKGLTTAQPRDATATATATATTTATATATATAADRPKPDPVTRFTRRFLSGLSLVLFVAFSVVILYGCFAILC